MLVDEHSQELPLATRQMGVVLRTLVKNDVSHLRFDLFDPDKVILGKLERFLWVVFKFDRAFVGCEVLTGAESIGNAGISLLFPATSIAVNGRAVRVRLAGDFDPLSTTATVDAKLGLTGRGRARLLGVTGHHAFVATLRLLF